MRPPIPEPLTLPWDLKREPHREVRRGRTQGRADEVLGRRDPDGHYAQHVRVVVQRRHPRRHGDRRPPSFEVPGLASR